MLAPKVLGKGQVAWRAWRPDHDELVVAIADPFRRQTLYLWKLGSTSARRLADGEGLLGGGAFDLPCALTATTAACVAASPAKPPRLIAIGLDHGESRLLAAPNSGLRLDPPGPVRPFEWRLPDGRSFSGWLLLPPATWPGRRPLFVTYYLCEGYLRGGLGDEYPLALLAQRGIAGLCINKAAQSDARYDAVGDYRTGLEAVRAAVAALAAKQVIDPAKVGMGGFSFGSEVTTWTAMNSDLLAAAAISSTQVEPAYYWLNGAPGRDAHAMLMRSWSLGAPDETPERWKLISPALNVDRIRAPLLMQLPEQEYRLSFELFARLSATPTPVELWVYANEPHNKIEPRHKRAVYQRNLDWFQFWLLDQIDPAPEKADQYRRWRAMAARRAGAQLSPGSSQP